MIASLPSTNSASASDSDTPAAERRHLTILFCDMVGSTEYADHLDPEDFRQLVETFLQTCSTAIRRHGGVVASYIGDAVKAYFGYPVAEEDDAERALVSALEILEALAGVAERGGRPLRVRLGVASGQVVVGSFLGAPAGVSIVAFGHVAHLAARLQVLAEPNTILTDAATFQAAEGAIEFTDFGLHALKGFSDPVPVWQARRSRSLPSRFARRTRLTRLCGRDEEVSLLLQQWRKVERERRGQVVVVSGEAGIGKSRLLNEAQLRLRPPTQLLMQCSAAFANSTLYPFLAELKRRAAIDENDAGEEKLRKLGSTLSAGQTPSEAALAILANLLAIQTDAPQALSGISLERQRSITQETFVDWIGGLARANPTLVLFEDEQWADIASRELLTILAESLRSIPALILVSTRTEPEASWIVPEAALKVELGPLNPSDASAIIRDMSAAAALPSDEVIAFVLDRAEGVPLYIEELTRSVLETGLPVDASVPKQRSRTGDIPSSLQSSLLARLDRLGPAKAVAQIAATIGREFDLDLLQEISGLPSSTLHAELGNLVRSGLIAPQSRVNGSAFSFRHALLQQAAQGTMLRERRQQLHGAIAGLMEMRDPGASAAYPELLAQHFFEAGLFDRAADYWLLAGLRAGTTWAKVGAAQMFGRGLDAARMMRDSHERDRRMLRLELERGDVLYAAFGYVTAEGSAAYHRAIKLSEKLGDPEAPIRALDGLFGTHFNSGQFANAIGASAHLIDIGESGDNIKALVLGLQFMGMSLFCKGELESARQYLERALSHREKAGEVGSDFPSMAMIYLSWTMHILGYHEAALDLFREAEAIVRQQSAYRLAACLGNGCILFAFREERANVMRLTEELLPLAQENGFNLWAKMARFFSGWALTDAEGMVAGTALMQDTVNALEDQEVDKSCYLLLLSKAYLRSGQLDRAAETARLGLEQANKIGEHYCTAALLTIRGEIDLCRGVEHGTAEACFREAIAFAQKQGARSWELHASEGLASILRMQGRDDEAKRELRPIMDWFRKEGGHATHPVEIGLFGKAWSRPKSRSP